MSVYSAFSSLSPHKPPIPPPRLVIPYPYPDKDASRPPAPGPTRADANHTMAFLVRAHRQMLEARNSASAMWTPPEELPRAAAPVPGGERDVREWEERPNGREWTEEELANVRSRVSRMVEDGFAVSLRAGGFARCVSRRSLVFSVITLADPFW